MKRGVILKLTEEYAYYNVMIAGDEHGRPTIFNGSMLRLAGDNIYFLLDYVVPSEYIKLYRLPLEVLEKTRKLWAFSPFFRKAIAFFALNYLSPYETYTIVEREYNTRNVLEKKLVTPDDIKVAFKKVAINKLATTFELDIPYELYKMERTEEGFLRFPWEKHINRPKKLKYRIYHTNKINQFVRILGYLQKHDMETYKTLIHNLRNIKKSDSRINKLIKDRNPSDFLVDPIIYLQPIQENASQIVAVQLALNWKVYNAGGHYLLLCNTIADLAKCYTQIAKHNNDLFIEYSVFAEKLTYALYKKCFTGG